MTVLGLLADTHIPDRAEALHPAILPIFRDARVTAILHAGDVSVAPVIHELETVAPVYAVLGNRDIYHLRHLPMSRLLHFDGVPVGLVHGQGSVWFYLYEKIHVLTIGYRLEFYLPYLFRTLPRARVIVFGHSHMPMIRWVKGTLIVNPGSASCPNREHLPSIGLLRLEGGQVEAELVWLR